MAEINDKRWKNQQQQGKQQHQAPKETGKQEVEKPAEMEESKVPPAGVMTSPTDTVAERPPAADDGEASRILASQATMRPNDPRTTMAFPGDDPEKPDNSDRGSGKDHLINDHAIRVGNKRRFLTDALCRALGCEGYLLEVDKMWGPNPLGRGENIAIRYTREFLSVYVLFDKYEIMPDPKILELKKKLANQHGYKYIYETPEVVISHDNLLEMLKEQASVKHPDTLEREAVEKERSAKR